MTDDLFFSTAHESKLQVPVFISHDTVQQIQLSLCRKQLVLILAEKDRNIPWPGRVPPTVSQFLQGGTKNRIDLRVDNFATVNGRKACDMSKVSEFCLERRTKLAYQYV